MGTFTLDEYVHEYAQSHRNAINEVIHCICVPAIVFSVLGALLSTGIIVVIPAIVIAIIYYVRLSLHAGVEMAFLPSLC
jgi:uncharacterized membrane protein YGL010W